MHEYEIALLDLLKKRKESKIDEAAEELGLNKDKLMWAAENLKSDGLIIVERTSQDEYLITAEGKNYFKGLPEELLAKAAKSKPLKMDGTINNIGLSWAKKNGWIEIKNGIISATPKWDHDSKIAYQQKAMLLKVSESRIDGKLSQQEKEALSTLIKRGLVEKSTKSTDASIKITEKGAATKTESKGIGALTRELIIKESWKKDSIRPYDIHAEYEKINPARQHPMRDFMNVVRDAWFKMGFMETSGPIIESAFWNFDTLFSPQDHPTRDMQDTFFLSNPKYVDVEDLELLERVRKMHKLGWKQQFNDQLSKAALLRTHTTSVSARNIRKYAELSSENYPIKLFSIGKVFRNESVDYKHMAEFYQTEGIIIGDNLNFSNLLDTLKRFWLQLGVDTIRFKPSYFPFTEPSLEVQYYDEKLGEEIELGGAGIIRSEITRAMGTNKTVLAWGLGLERMAMRLIDVDTLPILYKNDIDWLRKRKEIEV